MGDRIARGNKDSDHLKGINSLDSARNLFDAKRSGDTGNKIEADSLGPSLDKQVRGGAEKMKTGGLSALGWLMSECGMPANLALEFLKKNGLNRNSNYSDQLAAKYRAEFEERRTRRTDELPQ